MRALLSRVLLPLICVAMIAPLSGPLSMMAQVGEDEEGMVYCYCYSEEGLDEVLAAKRNLSMELRFPAAGGQVQGTYRSMSFGGKMSRLYDEDGSYRDFLEDCTVNATIQFDGFYSGGDTGVFTLEATGSATVDIDNSVDDRFDRSYRAELTNPAFDLDATADGIRNADGSVTISEMSGQFTPVSIDANEIPNTEWVEPSAQTISPNLTLTCTSQAQPETPPEMSCSIATIPDQIGPQDTTFQARGTASGFAGDTTWTWTLSGPGKYESGQGQNPTMYWGGTTYPPGFYHLSARVTDGQYIAQCHKHFSIGDVPPNNPPECLDVRIVPSSPPAGALSLRAEVDAHDPDSGDSLRYDFELLQGVVSIGASVTPPGVVLPPSYTFSIPGGLQPGPHTVLVHVFDGQQSVACQRHFTIPGAGPPTTQPPTAQPPGPPVTTTQPPTVQPPGPPQTSCTITTVPDPIGPGDTTFQGSVTASGLAAGASPSDCDLSGPVPPVNCQFQGWNLTVSYPAAAWNPGYYTLRARISDGTYDAWCFKYWSVSAPQNSPPQCVGIDLSPSVPSAGDTSLEVTVRAQDSDQDSLNYNWQDLFDRNTGLPGAPGGNGQGSPRWRYSIPGGLPAGTYPIQVAVDDGKQDVFCTRYFIVPQPTGPVQPPVPVQPPGPPPVGPPTGPPQPPEPPPQPPVPPAPPPVPPPSGDCGPVQLIYLDDLGVGMNQTEIDAFIENALAQGGPDYSLIISHRERLTDKFGQQGFEQIDALLRDLGNIAETCPFVLIVGDPDVVPFGVLPNPTNDGDVLFTDDVYGDNDHDNLTLLDIPVARIPDGYSLDLLLTQLSPSNLPASGDFTLANSKRLHADGVASQVFGPGRSLFWSLPTRSTDFDPSLVNVRYSYFMLHGASNDTRIWWGEEDAYPDAFTVAEASSRGIVLGGACYGAYTFNRTPQDSIALAFLASGARAFVGATGITYSPIWPSGPARTGPMRFDAAFQYAFLDATSQGQAPLAAFMEAKRRLADLASTGDATAAELKMLHELLYYGKP